MITREEIGNILDEFLSTNMDETEIAPEIFGVYEAAQKIWERIAEELLTHIWRPIESAPKDGTEILVYSKEEGIHMVFYTSEIFYRKTRYSFWAVVGSEDEDGGFMSIDNPTYWMPLPEKPKEK